MGEINLRTPSTTSFELKKTKSDIIEKPINNERSKDIQVAITSN